MTPLLLAFLGLLASGASFYAIHGALWGGHTAEQGAIYAASGAVIWGVFAYSSLEVRVDWHEQAGEAVNASFEPLALLGLIGFVAMSLLTAYASLELLRP